MNNITENSIPDVQGSHDYRQIAITRVGVRDVRIPWRLQHQDGRISSTIAIAEMTVALQEDKKGTHMSRFVNLLNNDKAMTLNDTIELHRHMLEVLNANEGKLQLSFDYFMRKKAPISKIESLMNYRVSLCIDGDRDAALWVEVLVPVTSLCPCSKEISRYGAHNQRSHIIIAAKFDDEQPFVIDELIRIGEEEGSCEIWATLKRPDEKYVTEKAYENPKFVEDIVRDVALRLNNDARIGAYRVSSENFESIHNHSAYALIEKLAH